LVDLFRIVSPDAVLAHIVINCRGGGADQA